MMNPTIAVLQLSCDTCLGDFHSLGRDTNDDYCFVELSVAIVKVTVESSLHQLVPKVGFDHTDLTTNQRQQLETLIMT